MSSSYNNIFKERTANKKVSPSPTQSKLLESKIIQDLESFSKRGKGSQDNAKIKSQNSGTMEPSNFSKSESAEIRKIIQKEIEGCNGNILQIKSTLATLLSQKERENKQKNEDFPLNSNSPIAKNIEKNISIKITPIQAQIDKNEKSLKSLEDEINDLKNKWKDIPKIKENIKHIQDLQKNADDEIDDAKKRIATLEKDVSGLKSTLVKIDTRLNKDSKSFSNLCTKVDSVEKENKSSYSELTTKVTEQAKNIKAVNAEISKINNKINTEKQKEIDDIKKEIQKFNDQIAECLNQIKGKEEDIGNLTDNYNTMSQTIEEIKKGLVEGNFQEQIDEHSKRLSTYGDNITNLNDEVGKLKINGNEVKKAIQQQQEKEVQRENEKKIKGEKLQELQEQLQKVTQKLSETSKKPKAKASTKSKKQKPINQKKIGENKNSEENDEEPEGDKDSLMSDNEIELNDKKENSGNEKGENQDEDSQEEDDMGDEEYEEDTKNENGKNLKSKRKATGKKHGTKEEEDNEEELEEEAEEPDSINEKPSRSRNIKHQPKSKVLSKASIEKKVISFEKQITTLANKISAFKKSLPEGQNQPGTEKGKGRSQREPTPSFSYRETTNASMKDIKSIDDKLQTLCEENEKQNKKIEQILNELSRSGRNDLKEELFKLQSEVNEIKNFCGSLDPRISYIPNGMLVNNQNDLLAYTNGSGKLKESSLGTIYGSSQNSINKYQIKPRTGKSKTNDAFQSSNAVELIQNPLPKKEKIKYVKKFIVPRAEANPTIEIDMVEELKSENNKESTEENHEIVYTNESLKAEEGVFLNTVTEE